MLNVQLQNPVSFDMHLSIRHPRQHFALGRVLLFCVVLAAGARGEIPNSKAGLEGAYLYSGKGLVGGMFRGEAQIEAQGAHWKMSWGNDGDPAGRALVLAQGGCLAVGQAGEDFTGIALYEIRGTRLLGCFTAPEMNGIVGRQELRGGPDLTGTFSDPESESSGGVVFIPEGKGLRVEWTQGERVFHGVGAVVERHVAVIFGLAKGSPRSIALYQMKEGVWSGVQVQGGDMDVSPCALRPLDGPARMPVLDYSFLLFGGEGWRMVRTAADPDGGITELREYRPVNGNTARAKLLTLSHHRTTTAGADAYVRELIGGFTAQEGYAGHVIKASRDLGTGMVTFTGKSSDTTMNIFNASRAPDGFHVIQIRLANEHPFVAREAFLREQEIRMPYWVADAEWLAPTVGEIMLSTRPTNSAP